MYILYIKIGIISCNGRIPGPVTFLAASLPLRASISASNSTGSPSPRDLKPLDWMWE